jgi:hypothetical protein
MHEARARQGQGQLVLGHVRGWWWCVVCEAGEEHLAASPSSPVFWPHRGGGGHRYGVMETHKAATRGT